MIVSIPIVWFIVPETSKIPLEKMDTLFSLPPRQARKLMMQRSADERDQLAPVDDANDEKAVESREEYV